MTWTIYLALGSALLALIYGAVSITQVMKLPRGNEAMQGISDAIQQGASAYLRRQYTTIAIVGVVLLIIIAVALDLYTAIGFLIGAILSGTAGFIGMNVSVRANARPTEDATRVRPGQPPKLHALD